MNRYRITTALFVSVVLVSCGPVTSADAQDLAGVKCIVMGERGATEKHSSKHLDGNVHFCCPRCKTTFDGDPKKYTTKANHQLVVSGQYVQTACLSGEKITDNQRKVKVMGVEMVFCDEKLMMKVSNAAGEEKAEMVFGDKVFARAFSKSSVDVSKANCILMPKRSANEDFAVDYKDAKVYFCCSRCVAKFNDKKSEAEVAARANHQLFATGQYKQKSCPMGGGAVKDDHYTEVGGSKVHYCCPKCKTKLEEMPDDEQLTKLFNDENFKKTFEAASK